MLLIAEILLTIAAWQKGWKAWALLPMTILFALGFLIGLVIDPGSTCEEDLMAFGLILDLGNIGVLITMTARPPKRGHDGKPVELPTGSVLPARQS